MKQPILQPSLKLTQNEIDTLNELARQTGSFAKRGGNKSESTNGQPSWRVLLRRIASGELIVSENPTLKD